jgi:hypothetical protein
MARADRELLASAGLLRPTSNLIWISMAIPTHGLGWLASVVMGGMVLKVASE